MFGFILQENKALSKSLSIEVKLNKRILEIQKEQYHENKWKTILQEIDKWNVEELSINNIKNQEIIKQISHIRFNNLKFLLLRHNYINNIQQLYQIDFSNLEQLHFNENKVTRIGCLNKLSMKRLITLSLNQNPIIQINSLTRIKFNDKHELKWIFLQYNPKQEPISQTLQQLLKLDAKKIQILWYQFKKRIYKSNVKHMITSKYEIKSLYQ